MRFTTFLAAASLAMALPAAAYAANDFQGTWKVQDTKGKPFQITLNADGSAKGDRAGEGLKGTWKAQGDSAVINWDSNWTTKITKHGSGYVKTAAEKGKPEGKSSPAEKVE